MTTPKRHRLKLNKLKFISAVDQPAQSFATAAIIKRAELGDDITATVRVAKVDESGIVFGFALTSTVGGEPHYDLQGDAIDEADLVKVAEAYLADGGATDEMHDRDPDGKVVFMYPLTSEIAAALKIDTDRTGLLVGIKPSPDVLEKFKSGEYTGFSIDGVGERTPVEKRSPYEVEKAKIVEEQLAWLAEMEAAGKGDHADEIAKRNVNSIGKWGQVWLDRRAKVAEKAATESVFKRNMEAFTKAAQNLENYVDRYAFLSKSVTPMVDLAKQNDPEYVRLVKAHERARDVAMFGDAESVAAPYVAQIEDLEKRMEAEVEKFSLAHNLDRDAASARLRSISKGFAGLYASWQKANANRLNAIAKARHEAETFHVEENERKENEKLQAAKRADDEAHAAALTPAERAAHARVEELIKQGRAPREMAWNWAAQHDDVFKALANVAKAERRS